MKTMSTEGRLRTIQLWLDDSFMEIELMQPKDWDEDKFTEAAVDYVLSNIAIDILLPLLNLKIFRISDIIIL